MATMIRPSKKAAQIAYRLLGNPPNGYKLSNRRPKRQLVEQKEVTDRSPSLAMGGVLTH